jgi:integrase
MLKQAVDDYLALRRSVGFIMNTHERLLRSFVSFADARDETHVVAKTAIEWARYGTSPAQQSRRLRVVVDFSRACRIEDVRHEVPSIEAIPRVKKQPRPVPYIYSQEEICQILEEASRLGPPGSLRPHTYQTLFGLLAATGLRVSEALRLRLDNVTSEGLLVLDTKFRKSRLVVMHETTSDALQRYITRRLQFGGADNHVFISLAGHGLFYGNVNSVFLKVVRKMGIHPGPGKRGPRLHDLRHTLAVRALEAAPTHQRHAIAQHMLALSTYLGHAEISDTYWYLEATPQLLGDIADHCAALFEGGQQ